MNIGKSLDDVISENLQYYRNQTHLTQAELAEKLNVSISHIANIERKESSASLALISRILDLFHITPNDLMLDKAPLITLTAEQRISTMISEKLDAAKFEICSEIMNIEKINSSGLTYGKKSRSRPDRRIVSDYQKK